MKIITKPEPEYIEIPVTDYEILYVGGLTDLITVKSEDSVLDGRDQIVVTTPHERIVVHHAHILAYRVRTRLMKVAVPPKPLPEPAPIDTLDV